MRHNPSSGGNSFVYILPYFSINKMNNRHVAISKRESKRSSFFCEFGQKHQSLRLEHVHPRGEPNQGGQSIVDREKRCDFILQLLSVVLHLLQNKSTVFKLAPIGKSLPPKPIKSQQMHKPNQCMYSTF